MSIDPNLITTIRVDQLPDGVLSLTNLIAHTVGTDLKKATIQDLSDLIATQIGTTDAVGYYPLSVTDGQQLPAVPANPSFFLCGAGTYLNINGYPDVVCTEELNVVMSLSDHWELSVEIPITAEIGVQSVTGDTVDNTDPANPVVVTPNLSQVFNKKDREVITHDVTTGDFTFDATHVGKYIGFYGIGRCDAIIPDDTYDPDIWVNLVGGVEEGAYINLVLTAGAVSTVIGHEKRIIHFEAKLTDPLANGWVVDAEPVSQFEIQLTQAGTDAPDIVTDSIFGAMGASISTTYNTDGEYYIVSDLSIFANVKDYIKNSVYRKIDFYTVFDGSNTYAIAISYVDDYTILIKSYNYSDLFSVYLSNDIMQETTLIKIPFKP